jgi:hypothetical protein
MSAKMIKFRLHRIKSSLYILFSVGAISSIWLAFVPAYGVEFYSKDESPFGISNSDWVAKFWTWNFFLPFDQQANQLTGLKQNGCLINKENSMVMLPDTSVGGVWNQNCTISRNDGILIPIWTGECNAGEKDCLNKPFEELSKAARNIDLGKINGLVKVDNIPVAELDVLDYKNNKMNNVTEVNTKQFNATIPNDSRMKTEDESYGKTFPGAAHGWFAFLKPLQPGNHTVYYQNSVGETTLSGAGNTNAAEFTYHFKVQ